MYKITAFAFFLFVLLALGVVVSPSPARAACASPSGQAADIVYNTSQKMFQYCNGTDWVGMSRSAGSGSGGCNLGAAGTFEEGQLIYDKDSRTLTGCTGNTQTALGPVGGGKHRWLQIAVGDSYNCGIKSDNKLYCWGANSQGRTGMGTSLGITYIPTEVSGGGGWKHIAVGTYHTCGIKSDDTLWCWGYNANGQIGDNSTTQRLVPTAVNGGGTWKQVDLGQAHSCAIKSDDTLHCWGSNANGRTGLNTAAGNTLVPTQISGGGAWKQVNAGYEHACGIMSDDTARCWGRNNNGEIGDNSSTQRLVATALNGGGTWKYLDAGVSNTCGIKSDDTIRCWGSNWSGQIGDNSTTTRLVPTAVNGGGTWKRVTAGSGHTCGIRMDDTMRCWGSNSSGKLGDNTFTQRLVPTALYDGGTWESVDNAANNTCGIRLDGVLYCWGQNNYGQLGDNTAPETAVPIALSGTDSWKQVSIGTYSSCGIKSDNKLYCWGENYEGEMGYGAQYDYSSVPGEVSGGGSWKFLSASNGRYSTCGIKSDDTLWCWGYNASGQLGDNSTTRRLVPTAVNGGGTWKFVTAGNSQTCGIKSDDTLWCWGGNASGALGDNSTTQRLVPTAVSGGGTWINVSSAFGYTCAIKSDNTLWCWGSNTDGKTGLNTSTGNTLIPTQITGGGSWQQVVTGYNATCGLKTDGSAWCWGMNWYGNLGDGTYNNSLVPVAVSGGHTWKQIAFADNIDYQWAHVCAIRTDGSAWCWGANDSGQRGDGTYNDSEIPVLVNGGTTWAQIAVNSGNTYGISLKGGQLYGWGMSDYAKLMDDDSLPAYRLTGVTPACSSPMGLAGALIYNSDFNVMQYCDGVGWVRVGQ